MTPRARVLLAITVYDGRAFVPAAISSAMAISTANHDLDLLVLDDHSPEPGWSESLAALCGELGVRYYCTPRNLGIPRNVNLALLAAHEERYTHVIIANSDVRFPRNLVDVQVAVCSSDARIASVTAWSNNASLYSLPYGADPAGLDDQERVDWLSGALNAHYGSRALDVPAGISFCMMVPASAISAVGLMDPVFGRGYCEETDWSLRSLALGFRCTVAPGVFVYHAGRGSNESAGLLRTGATSVDEHEAIIDMRYPMFRPDVGRYEASGVLDALHEEAALAICRAAARDMGYSVEVGYLRAGSGDDGPTVSIDPSSSTSITTIHYLGFSAIVPLDLGPGAGDLGDQLVAFAGRPPTGVNLLDRGPHTQHLLATLGVVDDDRPGYPSRV